MSDKIEPIRHKLSEAVTPPEDVTPEAPSGPPRDAKMTDAEVKQHNAEAQPTREERLVDIGRAHQLPGRGPQ